MIESTLKGDFHSVGDTIDVLLENSSFFRNENQDKDSHGLGLYANHVNLTTQNSSIAGHSLDGIHIESTTTNWNSNQSTSEGNGQDGVDVNGALTWESESDVIATNASRGLAVSGDVEWTSTQSTIADNGNDGFVIGGNAAWNSAQDVISSNGSEGLTVSGALTSMRTARL